MTTRQPSRTHVERRRRRQLEQALRRPAPEPHELADLAPEEWAHVELLSEPVEVSAGHRVIAQGEFGHDFYVIEAGIGQVTRDGRLLGVLGPGDFFGEIGMLREDTRTATVHAATGMRLRVVRGGEFDRLLRDVPVLAARVHGAIGERLLAPAPAYRALEPRLKSGPS